MSKLYGIWESQQQSKNTKLQQIITKTIFLVWSKVNKNLYCAITVANCQNVCIVRKLQAVYAVSLAIVSVLALAISMSERHQ